MLLEEEGEAAAHEEQVTRRALTQANRAPAGTTVHLPLGHSGNQQAVAYMQTQTAHIRTAGESHALARYSLPQLPCSS